MKITFFRIASLWKLSHVPSFIWMLLFSVSIFLITITNFQPRMEEMLPKMNEMVLKKQNIELHNSNKGYLIKTTGCRIPDLPVNTKALDQYFKYSFQGAHCNKDIPPLVDSNLTSLFIINTSLEIYNISNTSLLHCCYEELKRKIPHGESDNQYEFGEVCFDFEDEINVKEEFVHVKCSYSDKQIYEDMFAFIPQKHYLSPEISQGKLNVLMIGIDGISRTNFYRQMPKTVGYLKELDFHDFLGYNKIADNTYPNLIAVLTGNDEETISKTCKATTNYYDNCSFVWDYFKKNGYVTSFAEDSAWMGIFNYQRRGFQRQPTDYIWGFFDRIGENLLGNSKSMNVIQCIGAREGYKMIVRYIHDFVHQMKSWKLPYFAFFWSSSMSHDDVNKPRIGDELYLSLLRDMFSRGYFENTVVIIMSDHGIRFGPYRKTYQGRIEERLPFLFIRLPEEFKSSYPLATYNLKVNMGRLITPFDLHETLYDLSVPDNLKNEFIANEKRYSKSKDGLSLFHPIKPTRTCEDAGIVDHWCTCLESKVIEINSDVIHATNFTIKYLNNLLKGYAQCAKLHLGKINNAQLLSHSRRKLGAKESVRDFLISFETQPGGGAFEATVRKVNDKQMDIVGSVSRLNLYGGQSACITDFHLKLYCYCKKYVWD